MRGAGPSIGIFCHCIHFCDVAERDITAMLAVILRRVTAMTLVALGLQCI